MITTTQSQKAISALFRALGSISPYASSCHSAAKAGEKPVFPTIDPSGTADRFAVDYLAYNLVRKDEVGIYGRAYDCNLLEKEAVSGFLLTEHLLSYVNRKGRSPTPTPTGYPLAPEAIICLARRKIAYVLGSFSPDEMIEKAGFSGGASTRLRRSEGQPAFKFTGTPDVSRNCALLAVCAIWHSPSWRSYCQELHGRDSDPCSWVNVVRGSEYFTVPKTFDSLRGAAKEPDMNMYLQRGIGQMIRQRLKRVRCDLDDQTYNQYLSRCGSGTGSLCTIDLAAASDSVSLRIVEDLLPYDWYRFLLLTRSEEILLPGGEWHRLEKISSMGNGFTFELESLIFWGLAQAAVELTGCSDRRVGVYGDDLIVHHTASDALIAVLSYIGFNTNNEKTFTAGPFKESCGKHWFYGCDVSPFNVKRPLDDDGERYHYLNRLRLWIAQRSPEVRKHFDDVLSYLVRLLFPKGYDYVPPHLGTKAGMLCPNVGAAVGVYFCFSRQAYHYRRLRPVVPRKRRPPQWGGYFAWFQAEFGEVVITLPDKKEKRVRCKSYTSEWSDCEIGLLVT